jgi:hypothetical protein
MCYALKLSGRKKTYTSGACFGFLPSNWLAETWEFSRIGQRGSITATLWPCWAILRKGLIVVYSSPGKTQVIDIISLEGATLYQLAGGQKKRVLKRAFGLVQRNGMMHLVTVCTDGEYHEWIREMKRAIVAYGESSLYGDADSSPNHASLPQALSVPFDSESDHIGESSTHQPAASQGRLGRGLSRAVHAANATKKAVVDRSLRRNDEVESVENKEFGFENTPGIDPPPVGSGSSVVSTTGTEFTELSDDQSRAQSEASANRRVQIRNKFAVMGNATKSRFGSVVQKAREKGRAVAEKTRQPRLSRDSSPSTTERAATAENNSDG